MESLDGWLDDEHWEEILLCGNCGVEIVDTPGGKPRKWCSDACRIRDYYFRHPEKAEERRRRKREHAAANRKPRKTVIEHVCVECSGPFTSNHLVSKYCSIRCSGRASRRRRRARLREVASEDFTYLDVAERDEWMCQLCDEPVDRMLQKPDTMRGSLDHIHPISRGGDNTWGNIQLAHLRCNISKGARAMRGGFHARSSTEGTGGSRSPAQDIDDRNAAAGCRPARP